MCSKHLLRGKIRNIFVKAFIMEAFSNFQACNFNKQDADIFVDIFKKLWQNLFSRIVAWNCFCINSEQHFETKPAKTVSKLAMHTKEQHPRLLF